MKKEQQIEIILSLRQWLDKNELQRLSSEHINEIYLDCMNEIEQKLIEENSN